MGRAPNLTRVALIVSGPGATPVATAFLPGFSHGGDMIPEEITGTMDMRDTGAVDGLAGSSSIEMLGPGTVRSKLDLRFSSDR